MIWFVLGVVIGLLVDVIIVVTVIALRVPVARTLKQVEARVKQKGKILEMDEGEVQDWIKQLPVE